MALQNLPVSLGARSYAVTCGPGALGQIGAVCAQLGATSRIFVAADAQVWALHGAALQAHLEREGKVISLALVPPGEASKSWEGLSRLCDAFAEAELSRADLVVAFGGGVVGDLAGLAAGLFKRGLRVIQIPTTLLAQVDSSVGGKTAIDISAGKNLVGLFHQPSAVLADTTVLATLPGREMRAGYAEVVKYGLIDDPEFFQWLEANRPRVLAGDQEALAFAVAHAIASKARVVAADERESGPRALLNLGHTFAHGLEAIAGYDGALLHGEAVAAGMVLAFEFSRARGHCAPDDAARVRAHLQAAGFELDLARLPGGPFPLEAMLAAMANDKKADASGLTLVLARGVGQAFIAKGFQRDDLRDFLTEKGAVLSP